MQHKQPRGFWGSPGLCGEGPTFGLQICERPVDSPRVRPLGFVVKDL
jgi:hypothetical protein